MSSAISASQVEKRICDLSPPGSTKPHGIGDHNDPLLREKTITLPTGETITEGMKLCESCYRKARQERLIASGARCDLSTPESPHKITSHGLKTDPQGRKKRITFEDGSVQDTKEVMKLCESCYKKARQEKLVASGAVCDLSAQLPNKTHNITTKGLLKHPEGLTHTVKQLDGSETTKIIKVCESCYKSISRQLKKEISSKNTQEEESFAAKRKKTTTLEPIAASAVEPQEILALSADEITNIIPIKEEPADLEDPDCQLEKTIYGGHEIDNTLPILQDPNNPHLDVLRKAEKKYPDIKVTNWGALAKSLSKMQKKEIQSASLEWIRLNEINREEYTRRLEALCEVTIPVDEDTPYRGRSVFAKRNIQQYEVIGPYAGAFLGSKKKLTQKMRKEGSIPVESYLFQTARPTHTIHAFKRGNVLSLINTGSLIGQEEIAKNNLVPIIIGENIVMIVATEEIHQGQELFLDYGPDYQPGRWIKTED